MKKTIFISSLLILIISVLGFVFIQNQKCEKKDDSVCDITIGKNTLSVIVAYSRKKQAKGLMFVKKLNKDSGMIFVYDRERYMSFWMKNTIIPLSIAFVKENGVISDLIKMYPELYSKDYELSHYDSSVPVKYAIEVSLGWFEQHGIKTGDIIAVPKLLQ